MNLHTAAPVAGLVGGTCWLARLVLNLAGAGASGAASVLYWAGILFLAVALVEAGMSLVSKGNIWLRAVVGVAFPLLIWSLIELLHPLGDPEMIDGVVGLIVIAVAGVQLRRHRAEAAPRRRAPGLHAR